MATDLELAHELADLADRITGRHFRAGPVPWQEKADGSPVTAVDLEVEQALVGELERRRPGDAFMGEEVGSIGGGERRWIVDGIDGTHSFASGRKEGGTLVALEADGEVLVGVATSAGLERRWWAGRGQGAWTAPLGRGGVKHRRLRASGRAWPRCRTGLLPAPEDLSGWRRVVAERVIAGLDRPALAAHPPLLVANGGLELSVHLWGGPWDHAAFVAIVEEAGGCFGDLWEHAGWTPPLRCSPTVRTPCGA